MALTRHVAGGWRGFHFLARCGIAFGQGRAKVLGEARFSMRGRRTRIVAAVAVLVATQTALANQLCLAGTQETECEASCCQQQMPQQQAANWAPGTEGQQHACCGATPTRSVAYVLPGKDAAKLNPQATHSPQGPAEGRPLAGVDAILLARRNDLPITHVPLTRSVLSVSLRC